MVNSTCPSCDVAVLHGELCFCPSCGDRLSPPSREDRPSAPAAGARRIVPHLVIAASLVLVLAVAAFLVQAFIFNPVAVPVAANVSTLPSPAAMLNVDGSTEILITQSLPPSDVNNSADRPNAEPLVTTHLTTPVPSNVPASAGPLITITGTPADSSHPAVIGSSKEVPVIDATSLETRIHERINRVRQEHGLSALGTDATLTSLARAHSAEMASNGYFGHVNLDERDATARGAAAGYTCHKAADPYYSYAIAENLYATYRYSSVLLIDSRETTFAWTTGESIAEEAVVAWMSSTGHRDNILDPGMGREGIGIAFGQGDMVFVTQDFC